MDARKISDSLGGKPCGNGFIMPCPAHDDQHPSLSVTDGDKGFPLLYCHAGCTFESIRDRLRDRGLWPESRRYPSQKKCHSGKKPRIQLLNALDFELCVYLQFHTPRMVDLHRSRNKAYVALHPEFKPMPFEPWEREITASKRIIRIMGELYG